MTEIVNFAVYRHFRNQRLYRVIGIAENNSTVSPYKGPMVIYMDMETFKLFYKTPEEFCQQVPVAGASVPRFTRIGT